MASDQNNVKAETNNPGKKGTKSAASRVKIVAPYSYVEVNIYPVLVCPVLFSRLF